MEGTTTMTHRWRHTHSTPHSCPPSLLIKLVRPPTPPGTSERPRRPLTTLRQTPVIPSLFSPRLSLVRQRPPLAIVRLALATLDRHPHQPGSTSHHPEFVSRQSEAVSLSGTAPGQPKTVYHQPETVSRQPQTPSREVAPTPHQSDTAPPSARDHLLSARDRPSSAKRCPLSTRDRPSSAQDRPLSAWDRPSSVRDCLSTPRDRPLSARDRRSSARDRPLSAQDRPSSARDCPLSAQDHPSSVRDCSLTPQDRLLSADRSSAAQDHLPTPWDRLSSALDRPRQPSTAWAWPSPSWDRSSAVRVFSSRTRALLELVSCCCSPAQPRLLPTSRWWASSWLGPVWLQPWSAWLHPWPVSVCPWQSYSSHSECNHCESPPMYLSWDPQPDIRPPATSPDSDFSPTPINREVVSSSLLADDTNDVESPVRTLKKKEKTNWMGVDDLEASSVSFEDETQQRAPQTHTPYRQL